MPADDRALILQARAGDQRAFRELVRRYQQKVYGIAFGMLRNADDAMDVTQEAFIKVHRYLDNFKGTSSFYTWVYRITVNLSIDHMRKHKKATVLDFDEAIAHDEETPDEIVPSTTGMNPVKNLDRQEMRHMIDTALDTLSPAHRAVILMREVQGLSYKEIAEVTEISIGTVESRIFRARTKLRAILLADLPKHDPE